MPRPASPTALKLPMQNDVAVQGTNDSSILSKASMAALGYFDDPFLAFFAAKPRRRAPLINRGYYIRAKAINHVLTRFLQIYSDQPCQILSLGAGFDTSYFRLKKRNLLGCCKFIELDFPGVVSRKARLIGAHSELRELIEDFQPSIDRLSMDDYVLIGQDLTDQDKLECELSKHIQSFSFPTLIFSECVLTYVNIDSSIHLIQQLGRLFSNSIFCTYEQVCPHDAFGRVMTGHFKKLQSPLRRIHTLDMMIKHVQLLTDKLDWPLARVMDMTFFFEQYLSCDERNRVNRIEPFDEFEEWHLKCAHYCIITAFRGLCTEQTNEILPKIQDPNFDWYHDIESFFTANKQTLVSGSRLFERCGHSCTEISRGKYLITGGFGVQESGGHSRLKDAYVIDVTTFTDRGDSSPPPETFIINRFELPTTRMFHSIIRLNDDDSFFMFGGRTSPVNTCHEHGAFSLANSQFLWQHKFESDVVDGAVPVGRWRHTLVKIGETIILFGGRTADVVLRDLWSLDIYSMTWRKLCAELLARHSHSADVSGDQMVMFGGLDEHMRALNRLEVVTVSQEPASIEQLEFNPPLPPRYSHTSRLSRDQQLIVIGGVDPTSHFEPPLLRICLRTRTWSYAHIPSVVDSPPLMLHNHSSLWLNESQLITLGGGGNCFSFGTHLNEGLTLLQFECKYSLSNTDWNVTEANVTEAVAVT